jgi:hypothetical protein
MNSIMMTNLLFQTMFGLKKRQQVQKLTYSGVPYQHRSERATPHKISYNTQTGHFILMGRQGIQFGVFLYIVRYHRSSATR